MLVIEEFSTGITPARTANGGWVSRGFTGRYMNSTFQEIPYGIERSIANREFAVSEGAFSDRPTVIGRMVGEWSIVALVTKGQDEKGRSASFYRYFLSQDPDGLSQILAWMKQEQAQGRSLAFNPYDQQTVGEPHRVQIVSELLDSPRYSIEQEIPCILNPHERYSVQQVNQMAITQAKYNDQPIAWAFNVEALEQPKRFQVIYPISESAVRRIQQALAAISIAPTSGIDEQAIKTAIRSLMNSSQAKSESVQTLVDSLDRVETMLGSIAAKAFWSDNFEGQGAGNALRQPMFSPQMSKLLTLRAMILPETIDEFLSWLQVRDPKKLSDQASASLTLQSQISTPVAPLANLLRKGVESVLEGVFDGKLSSESATWLLGSQGSVWNLPTRTVLNQIRQDLKVIGGRTGSYQLEGKIWREIWDKINSRISYPINTANDDRFLNLANLLIGLGEPAIAACFYYAGSGEVPNEIFKAAKTTRDLHAATNGLGGRAFGIELRKQITPFDTFRSVTSSSFTKNVLLPILGIVLFIGGGLYALDRAGVVNIFDQLSVKKTAPTSSPTAVVSLELPADMELFKPESLPPEVFNTLNSNGSFTSKFADTQASVVRLIKILKDSDLSKQISDKQMIEAMRDTIWKALESRSDTVALQPDQKSFLHYKGKEFFLPEPSQNLTQEQIQAIKKNWAVAIYYYQAQKKQEGQKNIEAAGYIRPDGATIGLLKQDIKQLMVNSASSPDATSPPNGQVTPSPAPMNSEPPSPREERNLGGNKRP